MKENLKTRILIVLMLAMAPKAASSQTLYFPPVNPSLPWDTLSPAATGWCTGYIDTLYDFLGQENTRAFIVLKDGKIILEKYFGTFTADSLWYWASAGKTLTAFLTGKAQEEGFLQLSDSSSKFLGTGWSNCTPAQEGAINVRNHLTMTTGLDDGVPDDDCTIDTCLNFLAPAGTRWAYHNAPYTLMEDLVSNATGQNYNVYTQQKLKVWTGMNGTWLPSGFNNVYVSNARSMARFGLLIQNKCIWNQDTLLRDTAYINQMTNSSQTLNPSYGYLWWLNGKSFYLLPGLQLQFPGSYAPSAPSDMYSAIGKNGQILSIAPSLGLIYVRMGDVPGSQTSSVPTLFCDQIWEKLNQVICNTSGLQAESFNRKAILSPNPSSDVFNLEFAEEVQVRTLDLAGREILTKTYPRGKHALDIGNWMRGMYLIQVIYSDGFVDTLKAIKN